MKVKSVTITGMHKVDKKTYTFNDDITYFIGENGSGKSTILEATQLALLGYIPGYAKTNESIMKHSSGPVMSVEAELEGDIKIIRTWTKSGTSVKSTTDVTGYDGNLIDLMGQVDLPVFDFNEFRSMTANKLKDWFISFLPSSDDALDIKKELKSVIGNRALPCDALLDDVDQWIKDNPSQNTLELVKNLNAKFKEDQSFVKGQVANLEGTIKSLIKYDDETEYDDVAIREEIDNLNDLKSKLMHYEATANVQQKAKADLDVLKSQLPSDRFEDDPQVKEIKGQIDELMKKNAVLKEDYNDLQSQINELQRQKLSLTEANSNCPYTHEFCKTAADLADSTKSKMEELNKQIDFKKEEIKDCDQTIQSANDRKMMSLQAELGAIQSKYDKLIAMQLQLENADVGERPTDKNILQIDQEIRNLQDRLVKIAANKKYDELSEKVTADKFNLENDLEVYKLWIKLTDANSLQTTLMNKPFEDLAGEMSTYLTQMFNKPVAAKFNLIAKANSFSFGLEQNGSYIEFDYLSSGERCLFTLALIMCILDKSSSEIRTILIDDILDHLDSDNASYLFDALKHVENIQFILAGVKECSDKSICKSVA